MPRYEVRWSAQASADLAYFTKAASALIKREVPRYLADQPVPSPGRAGQRKEMDPNPLGVQYRLQLGAYRVFYSVEEDARRVNIVRVGHKPGETLYLRGRPFPMRD